MGVLPVSSVMSTSTLAWIEGCRRSPGSAVEWLPPTFITAFARRSWGCGQAVACD